MLCSKCNQSFDSLLDDGLCPDCHARAEERRLAIIEMARQEHQEDGEVEIDNDAKLSEGTDNGCYVAAWVWFSFSGTEFDKETNEKGENLERPQTAESTE